MYEWDDEKSAANRRKHGVPFSVVEGFEWEYALVQQDRRYAYGEDRYRAFGRIGAQAYCIAFTFRGENLRIITIRRMHAKEAKRYGI